MILAEVNWLFGLFPDTMSKLCLKDVSDQVTTELTSRLQNDPVALERFYRSFGLDPGKLRTRRLSDIKELFPDTPVKMLRDVCEALQLYDLVELLDKVTKPRALRPALPLKEIEKLPRANNRPIKIFTKAEVVIINCTGEDGADCGAENFGSFFKVLNTQNQVTTLTAKSSRNLIEQLKELEESRMTKSYFIKKAKTEEERLKYGLENKIPCRYGPRWWIDSGEKVVPVHDEQGLSYKEEAEMKKELGDIMEKSKQLTKEIISINEEIKEKKEELKKEDETFKMTVSTQIDDWIEQAHDKGRSALIVDMALLPSTWNDIKPSYLVSDFFSFLLFAVLWSRYYGYPR